MRIGVLASSLTSKIGFSVLKLLKGMDQVSDIEVVLSENLALEFSLLENRHQFNVIFSNIALFDASTLVVFNLEHVNSLSKFEAHIILCPDQDLSGEIYNITNEISCILEEAKKRLGRFKHITYFSENEEARVCVTNTTAPIHFDLGLVGVRTWPPNFDQLFRSRKRILLVGDYLDESVESLNVRISNANNNVFFSPPSSPFPFVDQLENCANVGFVFPVIQSQNKIREIVDRLFDLGKDVYYDGTPTEISIPGCYPLENLGKASKSSLRVCKSIVDYLT